MFRTCSLTSFLIIDHQKYGLSCQNRGQMGSGFRYHVWILQNPNQIGLTAKVQLVQWLLAPLTSCWCIDTNTGPSFSPYPCVSATYRCLVIPCILDEMQRGQWQRATSPSSTPPRDSEDRGHSEERRPQRGGSTGPLKGPTASGSEG